MVKTMSKAAAAEAGEPARRASVATRSVDDLMPGKRPAAKASNAGDPTRIRQILRRRACLRARWPPPTTTSSPKTCSSAPTATLPSPRTCGSGGRSSRTRLKPAGYRPREDPHGPVLRRWQAVGACLFYFNFLLCEKSEITFPNTPFTLIGVSGTRKFAT